jgi:adenine phosphoribosyltransferase
MDLADSIRNIPDFPKPGIIFRDITTLIGDPNSFNETIEILYDRYKNINIDIVAAIESRGFIFGGALANKLGVGFVPIRKKNKLPWNTISETYELEYGTDTLEMHTDAIKPGENVLLLDDLIATGGSLKAAAKMIEKLDGIIVDIAVIIELADLNGRKKIEPYNLYSIMEFEDK